MDAEKRHHLKQNDLAEALAKLRDLGSHREVLYWAAAIVVVLAAFVVYRNWGSWQASRAARAWRGLSEVSQKVQSNTPGAMDELRGIVSDSSNPTLAAAARIRLAATLRAKATETGTLDTAALQQSVEVLQPLLNEPGLSPGLVGAAGLSLATSYETLGQFDDAERIYNLLLDEQRFAGTGYPKAAAERLKTLPELRKPVEFVAGLPPQEAPSVSVLTPEVMAGPPAPPAEAPDAETQPAATAEPAPADAAAQEQPAGNAAGDNFEPQPPATQPSGAQGP
jgi:hypothetical protein